MLKYITDQTESEDVLAKYISNVFGRKDVLSSLTQLLIDGSVQAIENEKTHDSAVQFAIGVVQNS